MDDDPHEESDDLRSLLVGQTPVDAGTDLGKEVMGRRRYDLVAVCLCGAQAGLEAGPLCLDPVEFEVEFGI